MFLRNRNIQDKIIVASKILRQQVETNFDASDISRLSLSSSELNDALELILSEPRVVVVPTAHSSSVNVMTTKEPHSFHSVITAKDVKQLASYSNLLWTEHINLQTIVEISTILILGILNQMHTLIIIPTLLVPLLDRRNRREVMSGERRAILLNLLMSRPVGLAALKVTLNLIVLRVHILIEIKRMCHSYRVL
jgi:hypothetical protein